VERLSPVSGLGAELAVLRPSRYLSFELVSKRSNVPRKLSRASNHPGETLTLDEHAFEVKGKYERVFAPNA